MNTDRTGAAVTYKELTPATITSASRIMLPTYPIMCLALAANYITDAPRLMLSPVLNAADHLLPLPAWGAMFGIAGLILLAGLASRRRVVYIVGLIVMCAAMLVWTAVLGFATYDNNASLSAPAWPAFACAACWASIRSLTTRESS